MFGDFFILVGIAICGCYIILRKILKRLERAEESEKNKVAKQNRIICIILRKILKRLERSEELGKIKVAKQNRKIKVAKQNSCNTANLNAWKELMIILIGALLAMLTTAFAEQCSDRKYVVKLMENAKKAVETQMKLDEKLLEFDWDEEQLRVNIDRNNASIMDRVLEDETVFANVSTASYSILYSAVCEANQYYYLINEGKTDPEEGLIRLQETYNLIIEISDIEIYRLKRPFRDEKARTRLGEVYTNWLSDHKDEYITSMGD